MLILVFKIVWIQFKKLLIILFSSEKWNIIQYTSAKIPRTPTQPLTQENI